ncbi:DUF5791 family protein [Halalkalirubrum salinum]|uniref:DUF5791 family protein n=1 Tax=Halalkalirubrum salinum TaxID=2563889 RepID=UPI0010FB15DB|nr:DUF5791 family protein [Halalkalirubrum salinum]
MLYDAASEPAAGTVSALRAAYDEQLAAVLESTDVEAAASETGIAAETLAAIAAGESPELTVREAVAVLALDPERPDADAIVYELRDHLLMGMTTGVLDVDTIASRIAIDLTGQEVQQALEGRTEMTLDHLAAIQHVIETQNDST